MNHAAKVMILYGDVGCYAHSTTQPSIFPLIEPGIFDTTNSTLQYGMKTCLISECANSLTKINNTDSENYIEFRVSYIENGLGHTLNIDNFFKDN